MKSLLITTIAVVVAYNAGMWRQHTKDMKVFEETFDRAKGPDQVTSMFDTINLWKMDEEDERTAEQLLGGWLRERAEM